jgi:hypothetical protein
MDFLDWLVDPPGDDRRDSGASVLRRQREEQEARQRELWDARLKELFLGPGAPPTPAEVLRAVVECDAWFVAAGPEGAIELEEVKPGRYDSAVGAPSERVKSNRKTGRGGRLLRVYGEKPDRPTVPMDGRALARALPDDADGLLLYQSDRAARELGREHFAALRALATACELEAMIVTPAEGQIEALRSATWLVPMSGDRPTLATPGLKERVAPAFTHPDRLGDNAGTVRPITGEALFRAVAEAPDVDGLVINPHRTMGQGPDRILNPVLSLGILCGLLTGDDLRPGARPLPARSLREVECWLALHGFPFENRELLQAPYPEETLVRARVPQDSEWTQREALCNRSPKPGPTWSPVFVVPAAGMAWPADVLELGPGPSRILCAGLLAQTLNAGASRGKGAATYWQVGTWVAGGRLLNEAQQAMSRRRLTLATELAKLLPPGADRIPRSALLTVKGAAFLAEHPHGTTRAWIEATVERAERFTHRWVWPG